MDHFGGTKEGCLSKNFSFFKIFFLLIIVFVTLNSRVLESNALAVAHVDRVRPLEVGNPTLTAIATSDGFSYYCALKTNIHDSSVHDFSKDSSYRVNILWKILQKDGSLKKTVHSPFLPAHDASSEMLIYCQVLIDDGIFFQIKEARLGQKSGPNQDIEQRNNEAHKLHDFSFLAAKSQLEWKTIGGMRYAFCSTGRNTFMQGSVVWTANDQIRESIKKNLVPAAAFPTGKITCRYSSLRTSDPIFNEGNFFFGTPTSVFMPSTQKSGFFLMKSDQPLDSIKCSTNIPSWKCTTHYFPDSQLSLVRYDSDALMHAATLTLEAKPVQAILPPLSSKIDGLVKDNPVAKHEVVMRTKESEPRKKIEFKVTLKKEPDSEIFSSSSRFYCDSAVGSDSITQSPTETTLTRNQKEGFEYFWLADSKLISQGFQPYFSETSLPQKTQRLTCGIIQSNGTSYSVGLSAPLALAHVIHKSDKSHKKNARNKPLSLQNIQPGQSSIWMILNNAALEKKVSIKIDSDSRQNHALESSNLALKCYLKIGSRIIAGRNACPDPAEKNSEVTGQKKQQNYEMTLRFSASELTQAWEMAPSSHALDRLAPRMVELFIFEANSTHPRFGLIPLTLLRKANAPRISSMSLKVSQPVHCAVTASDPDRDHLVGVMSVTDTFVTESHFSTLNMSPGELFHFEIAKNTSNAETSAENLTGPLRSEPLCKATISDGVLIARGDASLFKRDQIHKDPKESAEPLQALSMQQSSDNETPDHLAQHLLSPISWFAEDIAPKIWSHSLSIINFGSELIPIKNSESLEAIVACTSVLQAKCPQIELKKDGLSIVKNASVQSGVYLVFLSDQRGRISMLALDIFNDGFASSQEQDFHPHYERCASFLAASDSGIEGINISPFHSAYENSPAVTKVPFTNYSTLWSQTNTLVNFSQLTSLCEKLTHSTDFQADKIKQKKTTSSHSISLPPVQFNFLADSHFSPFHELVTQMPQILLKAHISSFPAFQIKNVQVCSRKLCYTHKTHPLENHMNKRNGQNLLALINSNPEIPLVAKIEVIFPDKQEVEFRFALRFQPIFPLAKYDAAQLYALSDPTENPQSKAEQNRAKNVFVCEIFGKMSSISQEPFKIQFSFLGQVIHSQESFNRRIEYRREKESDQVPDSCAFLLGSQIIARSILEPSADAKFICEATDGLGWTSKIPCQYTGMNKTKALDFNNINVNLGILAHQPVHFRAGWISEQGTYEKSFMHRFEDSVRPSFAPKKEGSHTELDGQPEISWPVSMPQPAGLIINIDQPARDFVNSVKGYLSIKETTIFDKNKKTKKFSVEKINCFYPSEASTLCQDVQSMVTLFAHTKSDIKPVSESPVFVQSISPHPMTLSEIKLIGVADSVEKAKEHENQTIESDTYNGNDSILNIVNIFQSPENPEIKNEISRLRKK